jgi:hypothetical protein
MWLLSFWTWLLHLIWCLQFHSSLWLNKTPLCICIYTHTHTRIIFSWFSHQL